jgi:hypothetical protein
VDRLLVSNQFGGRQASIDLVGEFRKTRHPRNIEFNEILEICFLGIHDFRESGTCEASVREHANFGDLESVKTRSHEHAEAWNLELAKARTSEDS